MNIFLILVHFEKTGTVAILCLGRLARGAINSRNDCLCVLGQAVAAKACHGSCRASPPPLGAARGGGACVRSQAAQNSLSSPDRAPLKRLLEWQGNHRHPGWHLGPAAVRGVMRSARGLEPARVGLQVHAQVKSRDQIRPLGSVSREATCGTKKSMRSEESAAVRILTRADG